MTPSIGSDGRQDANDLARGSSPNPSVARAGGASGLAVEYPVGDFTALPLERDSSNFNSITAVASLRNNGPQHGARASPQ